MNLFPVLIRFPELFRELGRRVVLALGRFAAEGRVGNYNLQVARGWESKSVEAQQAEVNDKSAKLRPAMSADEAARWRENESLRLSRRRVLQQMEASQNPRHRKLLEGALADLEEKLRRSQL
jgi:hypothetical protein